MQWLPPLLADAASCRLAISDRSAAVLACAMLEDDPLVAIDALADAVRKDPPLALWAACRAVQDGAEPRDAESLAAWLAGRAIEQLARPVMQGPEETLDDDLVKRYAHRVGQAVARAELAAALTAEDATAKPDESYLAALLHEPAMWFEPASPDMPKDTLLPLPDVLTREPAPTIAGRLAEAMGLLAKEPADDARGELIARSRRRGAAAARGWAESPSAPSIPLGELAARLGRLKILQTRFQETLEAEKLDAMAEFAAGAGHEINNPLAVIAGRAQLLLQEETDPERRRTLALMNAQAKRVYEMIADMMLFARPPKPAFERVDLVRLVDQLVDALRGRLAEQAVSLRRVERDEPITVDADPIQLNVALQALCRNAMEAIGHDGVIEISLDETDETVVIRVSDDGPGVSPEARRHLFDPYYSERQAGRGLGLGLSKCWRIVVTNHGGRIDVTSRPGHDTVFTMTLPKRQR